MYGQMHSAVCCEAELAEIRSARACTRTSACIDHAAGSAMVAVAGGAQVLNLCANNYLGLADHPAIVAAATHALTGLGLRHGQRALHLRHAELHKQLEAHLAAFSAPKTRSFTRSCFDANGGLFETLLDAEDAVISDEFNHASIIDGIRLCKAQRFRYRNNDMADLEAKLQGGRGGALPPDRHRRRLLHGRLHRQAGRRSATWPTSYDALVMVDDSHAVGFMGEHGRGTPRASRRDGPHRHSDRHAGQGAGRRQRRLHQRPQGDRRVAAPAFAAVSVLELRGAGRSSPPRSQVLELLSDSADLRDRLATNTRFFRAQMTDAGFNDPARRASHRAGHVRRRALSPRAWPSCCWTQGVYVVGLLLSRGAAGQGAHPHPDFRGAHARRSGVCAG